MLDRQDFIRPGRYRLACAMDRLAGWFLGRPAGGPPPDPSEVRRIVVLRLDHLGDVLLTTPALRDLRARFPTAHVTVLVGSWAREALEGNPNLDRLEVLDAPWLAFGAVADRGRWTAVWRAALALRRQRLDVSIDFRGDLLSALLSWIIGARRRLGLGHKGGAAFYTDLVPWRREAHAMEVAAAFVRYLGGEPVTRRPELTVEAEDRWRARALLARLGIDEGMSFVIFHPYSNVPGREWPVGAWLALGRLCIGEGGGPVVITGPVSRRVEAECLAAGLGPGGTAVAGCTSLRELAALFERAQALVTVDSAPRHVAAVTGTPTVVLRHGLDGYDDLMGPYRETEIVLRHPVTCSPCGQVVCPLPVQACMQAITPGAVMAALQQLEVLRARTDVR